MANISKITLPNNSKYNIKDAEALRVNETAVAAKKLASVHTLPSGVDGCWKFLEIPMQYVAHQTMVLSIDSNFSSSCGLLRIHTKRISNDVFQEIGWIASGKSHPTVRWKYSDSKWNLYLLKSSLETISFHVISATTDSSYTWKFDSVTVEDFIAATVADVYINLQAASATSDANGDQIDTTYLKSTGILYYENQTISIGTNAQLLSISAVEISDTHVLSKIDFANPEYITTGYTWTTADGSFKLVGTCTAATTANILLVRKGN